MKIKNHKIIREIHRGAITTVYQAHHTHLDRPVLLKVLNTQWLGENDLMERFHREARICARLRHPNIVTVYDFEVSDTLVYLSMEFVSGSPLNTYLRENGALTAEQARKLARDICHALAYAHEQGVIHRDIKPDNILLEPDGTARLTDFGLAAINESVTVTQQGQNMGTPAYMAPELIKGRPASVQSDLFSLGVTLYEACSGSSPFKQDTLAATFQHILTHNPLPLQSLRPDLDEIFCETVHSFMAKNPEKRPRKADAALFEKSKPANNKQNISQKFNYTPFFLVVAGLVLILTGIIGIYFFNMPNQHADRDNNVKNNVEQPDSSKRLITTSTITAQNKEKSKQLPQKKEIPAIPNSVTLKKARTTAPPSAVKSGRLFLTCTPWAAVYIDGDSLDMTPLKAPLQLTAGSHEMELRNPNYEIYRQTLEIRPDKTDTLHVKLKPTFAYLNIQASPWAKIFINGKYREDTPLSKPLAVRSGRVVIRLENPGLGIIYDTLNLKAQVVVHRSYSFKK